MISTKFSSTEEIMSQFKFVQDAAHEHEFVLGANLISFFAFEELFNLTAIRSSDIPIQEMDGINFRLPNKEQFLTIYSAGVKNKWRFE